MRDFTFFLVILVLGVLHFVAASVIKPKPVPLNAHITTSTRISDLTHSLKVTSNRKTLLNDPVKASNRVSIFAKKTPLPLETTAAILSQVLVPQTNSVVDISTILPGVQVQPFVSHNITICFGMLPEDPSVCSGNGACIANDTCKCTTHYTGIACQTSLNRPFIMDNLLQQFDSLVEYLVKGDRQTEMRLRKDMDEAWAEMVKLEKLIEALERKLVIINEEISIVEQIIVLTSGLTDPAKKQQVKQLLDNLDSQFKQDREVVIKQLAKAKADMIVAIKVYIEARATYYKNPDYARRTLILAAANESEMRMASVDADRLQFKNELEWAKEDVAAFSSTASQ